jgi:3-oxoacyl-[acyl-carrier-protein] synthase II/nodulation protein E
VTPLGNDVQSTWQALLAGQSGIRPLTRFGAAEFDRPIAGECRDFSLQNPAPARRLRHLDRSSQLGIAAALAALNDAGLLDHSPLGNRAGVVFGSGLGGFATVESQANVLQWNGSSRLSPFFLSSILPDAASGHLAMLAGATGPNMSFLSASATGAAAIGEASEIIRRGDADVMIAGASESPLTPLLYAGFAAMRALAESGDDPASACRPFDLTRTGFVVAEGAGAMVIETLDHARARGATPYAELAGYGSANDAFDMVASEPIGRGPVQAMTTALRKAGLDADEICYINAHGTASRMNDRVETVAIKRVFGSHAHKLAVSSTKSMTGHLMGAAGAVEAVVSVLALYHGVLPPTINYESPDPDCDLDYVPNQARPAPGITAVLSHSIGLGGHNATLIFRRV